MMSENKSSNKRLLGFHISPVVLIRLSSVLVVLLMAGHTSVYPWTSTHGVQETRLLNLMKSVSGFWRILPVLPHDALASLLESSPRAAWPALVSLFVFSIYRRFYFFDYLRNPADGSRANTETEANVYPW